MKDFWTDHFDKMLIAALVVMFAVQASHGGDFAQRECDALCGGLLTLLVSKAASRKNDEKRKDDEPNA